MPSPNVMICFKNFAAWQGISHIGLGVSALLNSEVLTANGIPAITQPSRHNIDIVDAIREFDKTHSQKLTNVIISAPWISTKDLRAMATHFTHINFVVLCHSNIGFLQADPNGTRLLREGLALSQELPNFNIASNCRRFVDWIDIAYGIPVVLLPNMYPNIGETKPYRETEPIRIGVFGAVRPQKNIVTAGGAAVAICKLMNRPTELWFNSGRNEGGTITLLNALRQICIDVPGFELKQAPWGLWSEFKKTVESMDLLIQISYTESFNMVTADGISVGVPSVVSDAIDWAPKEWVAHSDDALDVARVGVKLLKSHRDRDRGGDALRKHNKTALESWKDYLYKEPSEAPIFKEE